MKLQMKNYFESCIFQILFTTLLQYELCSSTSEEVFKAWYDKIINAKHICKGSNTVFSAAVFKRTSMVLVSPSENCSVEHARWDYKIDNVNKQSRSTNILNGELNLKIPPKKARNYSTFNIGLKSKTCLNILFDNGHEIFGKFVNGSLEGRVTVKFEDGTTLLGTTRNSVLMAPFRYINVQRNIFINITLPSLNTHKTISMDNFGYFRIRNMSEFVSSYFNQSGILISRDFETIYFCKKEISTYILLGCIDVTSSIIVHFLDCDVSFIINEILTTNDTKFFHWNLRINDTADKFFYNNDDHLYTNCDPNWNEQKNRYTLLFEWLNMISASSEDHPDPFWREYVANERKNNVSGASTRTVTIDIPDLNTWYLKKSTIVKLEAFDVRVGSGRVQGGKIMCSLKKTMEGCSSCDDVQKCERTVNGPITLKLDSMDLYSSKETLFASLYLENGKIHGPVRYFGSSAANKKQPCILNYISNDLLFICRYVLGRAIGPCWRRTIGGGYLYGKVDNYGRFSGPDIGYIYPDLETVLIGTFENGVMINAKETTIKRTRCIDGIYELDLAIPWGTNFSYEVKSNITFCDNPIVTDPLDNKYVYTKRSDIEGMGLFAKRDISANTVFSQYNGLLMNREQLNIYRDNYVNHEKYVKTFLSNVKQDSSITRKYEYNMDLPECNMFMVCPPEICRNLKLYNSTLAHKANHSYRPNAHFGMLLDSPRFGIVRVFVAMREIKKDEEIFVNYGPVYEWENKNITYIGI